MQIICVEIVESLVNWSFQLTDWCHEAEKKIDLGAAAIRSIHFLVMKIISLVEYALQAAVKFFIGDRLLDPLAGFFKMSERLVSQEASFAIVFFLI